MTIIDDSRVSRCEGRCGLDLSAPERIRSIADLLKKIYGDAVRLDYYDVCGSSAEGSRLPLPEEVVAGTWSLPLLLVNGKLRISGYFDLRLMQDVIQAEIEMVSETGQ